jgi:hypothetical protein
MLQFLKMRKRLILLSVLACVGCTTGTGDNPGGRGAEAADPGDAPYPNLGAFPRPPARPTAAALTAEQAQLARQRDEARAFDSTLRALDPVLDPSARPPPPPAFTPPAAPPSQAAAAPLPPVAPPPSIAPQPAPTAVPAPTPAAPTPAAPVPPSVAASAQTSWIVGAVGYGDGSALLTAESRRLLREAVVAATERGGRIRITPLAAGALSPVEQALAGRRAAAAIGEIEALGLARERVIVDPGAFKAARVAVEF